MTFVNPGILVLLLLIPLAALLIVWRQRVKQTRLARLGDAVLLERLLPRMSITRQRVKLVCWLLAVAALIVALARPMWGVDVQIIETQGVSVMVLLDVSNSMLAQDVVPNRLTRAQLAIRDLVDGIAGNEVGLILFAGSAFVQFPLTTDSNSTITFLNAAGPDSISRQGTDLEAALQLAQESFNPRNPTSRFIVLFTDGEYHEGDPVRAAAQAEQDGITIFAIGYGGPEGVPVPVNEMDLLIDNEGQLVLSRLDETTLDAVTTTAGGRYWRASASGTEIDQLVDQINAAEVGLLGTRSANQGVERFALFVGLALLLLSVDMLLPTVRRGVL